MKWIKTQISRLFRQSGSGDSGENAPMDLGDGERMIFPEHIIIFAIFLVNLVAVILHLFR